MLQDLLGHFTYAAVFGLLIAGGVGIPVPEEMVQLTAGYLARRGVLSLLPTAAVAWSGIVLGDLVLFRLGRRHGPRFLESPHIARVVTPRRRAFIERHFARHPVLTIALARHAAGLRLVLRRPRPGGAAGGPLGGARGGARRRHRGGGLGLRGPPAGAASGRPAIERPTPRARRGDAAPPR